VELEEYSCRHLIINTCMAVEIVIITGRPPKEVLAQVIEESLNRFADSWKKRRRAPDE
jgi:hypothetical protein